MWQAIEDPDWWDSTILVHSAHLHPRWWAVFCPPCGGAKNNRLHSRYPLQHTSDWLIHNSLSVYMDCDGLHKSMSHFISNWLSFPLNTQVLFYDFHESHFGDRALDILCKHNIQPFILNAGDYVHDQPNDSGTNMKLKNLCVNSRINWTRKNLTLKFTLDHINYFLVPTWKAFKFSSAKINQNAFKNINIPPLSPPDIYTYDQACLAGNQQSNRENQMILDRYQRPVLRL